MPELFFNCRACCSFFICVVSSKLLEFAPGVHGFQKNLLGRRRTSKESACTMAVFGYQRIKQAFFENKSELERLRVDLLASNARLQPYMQKQNLATRHREIDNFAFFHTAACEFGRSQKTSSSPVARMLPCLHAFVLMFVKS